MRVAESQVNVTPFESEGEGLVTQEFSSTTPVPAKVNANEGLCQILFFRSEVACEVSKPIARARIKAGRGPYFQCFRSGFNERAPLVCRYILFARWSCALVAVLLLASWGS